MDLARFAHAEQLCMDSKLQQVLYIANWLEYGKG